MATTLRESERVGKLHAFRLREIPDCIREREAMLVESRLVQHELKTRHGIPATPEEGYAVLLQSVAVFRAWVVSPSDRVYRVRQDAWDTMLTQAEKIEKVKAREAVLARV